VAKLAQLVGGLVLWGMMLADLMLPSLKKDNDFCGILLLCYSWPVKLTNQGSGFCRHVLHQSIPESALFL